MRHFSQRFLVRSLSALAFSSLAGATLAQGFPDRPVEFVVPYPAGASVDMQARMLQNKMADVLGQTVIVENRPGAGSNIGAAYVARSEPDGHRILLATNATLVINPHVYPQIGYDVKDLTPITLLSSSPLAIGINSSLDINSVEALIEHAKANPGELSYGSPGVGSPQHLIGEMLASQADIDILHVPYKGVAPAMTDLLGGNIDMVISTLAGLSTHRDNPALDILAVTELERVPNEPDIPTVAETLPGFEASAWFAIMAPAGTPQDAIDKLHEAIVAGLETEDAQRLLKTANLTPVGGDAAAAQALIDTDFERWGKVVREQNIQVQ